MRRNIPRKKTLAFVAGLAVIAGGLYFPANAGADEQASVDGLLGILSELGLDELLAADDILPANGDEAGPAFLDGDGESILGLGLGLGLDLDLFDHPDWVGHADPGIIIENGAGEDGHEPTIGVDLPFMENRDWKGAAGDGINITPGADDTHTIKVDAPFIEARDWEGSAGQGISLTPNPLNNNKQTIAVALTSDKSVMTGAPVAILQNNNPNNQLDYQNIMALQITLPGPGTYMIDGNVRGRISGGTAYITARLRQAGGGAAGVLTDSTRIITQVIPPEVGTNSTAPISTTFTATDPGPTTLILQAACEGSASFCQIWSDADGLSTLRYVRIA